MGALGRGVLFGQNLFNAGGKYVTICEGELDALAAFEMLGSKWPVLSIKNGVQSALKDCKANLEYLSKFDNVVLCFDSDDKGRKAAQQVAALFEPNTCRIVSMTDGKDASEYLQEVSANSFHRHGGTPRSTPPQVYLIWLTWVMACTTKVSTRLVCIHSTV